MGKHDAMTKKGDSDPLSGCDFEYGILRGKGVWPHFDRTVAGAYYPTWVGDPNPKKGGRSR